MRRRYVCIDPDCPPGERFLLRLRAGHMAVPFEAASIEAAEINADAFEAEAEKRAAKRNAPRRRAAPAPTA